MVAAVDEGRQGHLGLVAMLGLAAWLVLVSLAWSTDAVGDASAPPSSIAAGAACSTAECHTDITQHRHLHWPELRTHCTDCHLPGATNHEFRVTESPELCERCHEQRMREMLAAKTVHSAAQDDCLGCHEVHGSEASALLIADPEDGLCLECHDDVMEGKYQHEPANEGYCVECHDPHASPNRKLLKNPDIPELCWECHDDHGEAMSSATYQHEATEDCTNCHNPHSGEHPRMLLAKGRKLCGECHDDVVELVDEAEVDHGAATTKKECLNCHSPHAADTAPLLVDTPQNLCLGCHGRPVRSGRSILLNMKAWLADNDMQHKPLSEKGCTACHRPHGGEHFRLLKAAFPTSFYSRFSAGRYGLCFSCHDSGALASPRTRSLTGFRDGDRNLHYLHVNRGEKGRSCRACHDPHAAMNGHLVRDYVRFGQWLLPVEFEGTPTGGSCQPGCHPPASYDRQRGS